MALQRIGGRVAIRVNGRTIEAPGEFTLRIGQPVRTAALGPNGPVGYLEEPGTAMISGPLYYLKLTADELDTLLRGEEQTVQLDLATGKQFVLENAWFSGEGEIDVAAGTMAAEWTGRQGRVVE